MDRSCFIISSGLVVESARGGWLQVVAVAVLSAIVVVVVVVVLVVPGVRN